MRVVEDVVLLNDRFIVLEANLIGETTLEFGAGEEDEVLVALDERRRLDDTVARDSYYIAIKYRDGLSELSEARNSCFVAIWTDSPPLFFIATQIGAGS